MAPANGGGVLYDNRDLYTHYAELRHRIGLVPQENILHTQLPAERALGYAAELRFPGDVSKAERQRRITEVLEELALTRHAETRVSAMSGGQQKRVNVALELLTKPSLLFLDEPTSGLDPGLDKSVMEQMADLAHDGRTIIVVTHSVANLNLCDRLLVLVPGGKIAYFALRRMACGTLARRAGRGVPGVRGRAEPGLGQRVPPVALLPALHRGRHGPAGTGRGGGQADVEAPHSRKPAGPAQHAGPALLAVISSDRGYLAALAIMPLLLGVLGRFIPAPQGLTGRGNSDAASLLLILVISACFTGAANSVRNWSRNGRSTPENGRPACRPARTCCRS